MIVYCNGRFLPASKATVSVFDRGFLYGDGVYETIRVYNRQPFLLSEHLARLRNSADRLSIPMPMTNSRLAHTILEVIRRNPWREAVVRITLSRGVSGRGFELPDTTRATLVISAHRFSPYPAWYHTSGIGLALVSVRRNSPLSVPPAVKSANCLNGILAKAEAASAGAQEGLMCGLDGFLTEGTVSNVFLVRRGCLATPKDDGTILAGVTRRFLCRLAENRGLTVAEKKVRPSDLLQADEIFLTNTTMEVVPVRYFIWQDARRRWKRKAVGRTRPSVPGPVTRRLAADFTRAVILFRNTGLV